MLISYSFYVVLSLSVIFNFWKIYLASLGILVLHECVHLFVSYIYGEKIKKIKLYGFGISIELETYAFYENYVKEIVICLSAPIFNLLFGFFLLYMKAEFLAYLNISIGAINLLPVLPLDGGRALRSYICNKYGITRGYKQTIIISRIFLIILAIFSIYFICFNFNLSIILITAFLWTNVLFEEKRLNLLKLKNMLYNENKIKTYKRASVITAKSNLSAFRLLKEFSLNKYNIICRIPDNKIITETDIYNGIKQNGVRTKLVDI